MATIYHKRFSRTTFAIAVCALGLFALGACSDAVGLVPPPDATVFDAPPSGCTETDAIVTIADNHQHAEHAMTVTSADVQAGAMMDYDMMGDATHTHTLTVTAPDFTSLGSGGTISETSSFTIDHMHVVTVSCP